jgi:cytochrome c556
MMISLLRPRASQTFVVAIGWLVSFGLGQLLTAAEPDRSLTALHAVFARNISHSSDWLEANDFRSLAESGNKLQLLGEMLRGKSDDQAWQEASRKVLTAVGEVRSAASRNDAAKARAALGGLEQAASALAAVAPTGQPQPPARTPGIRLVMLLMDGVAADAKVALLTNNTQSAKNQAYALSELASLVSNFRSEEQWTSLLDEFSQAARAAATTAETDPKAVRHIFRGMTQRCDTCHEVLRPQRP